MKRGWGKEKVYGVFVLHFSGLGYLLFFRDDGCTFKSPSHSFGRFVVRMGGYGEEGGKGGREEGGKRWTTSCLKRIPYVSEKMEVKNERGGQHVCINSFGSFDSLWENMWIGRKITGETHIHTRLG